MTAAVFSDTLFPLEVSAWAVGGRGFKTTDVETYGGDSYRNAAWPQALGEWDVTEALRSTNPKNSYAIAALRKFIMGGFGQLNGFRFRDPQDHDDEGHGIFVTLTSTTFQMYKRYSLGSINYDQIIQKPSGSITVTGGSGASVAANTGICTVSSGTPTAWTGLFDIPARFADDYPHIGLDQSGAYWNWQQIKIKEWRNWA